MVVVWGGGLGSGRVVGVGVGQGAIKARQWHSMAPGVSAGPNCRTPAHTQPTHTSWASTHEHTHTVNQSQP
jgi:hypothetical protein